MPTKVILTLAGGLPAGVDASKIEQLLRDALGEFCHARFPAVEYVSRRYADSPDLNTTKKVLEVQARIDLASQIRGASVGIALVPDDCPLVTCGPGDKCETCGVQATDVALDPVPYHVGKFCEVHAEGAVEKRRPEYRHSCPNCGCLSGVN